VADERYPLKRSITGKQSLDRYKNLFKIALRNRRLARDRGEMEEVREHGGTMDYMTKRMARVVKGGSSEAKKIASGLEKDFNREIEAKKARVKAATREREQVEKVRGY
jgi:hypothetical protein